MEFYSHIIKEMKMVEDQKGLLCVGLQVIVQWMKTYYIQN